MFTLNQKTGAITIPQGDTATFRINMECGPFPEDTVAVFGIVTTGTATCLFSKVFEVKDNQVIVRLTNQETRQIPVGTYQWDCRIVTEPNRKGDGITAEDPGDNVYSLFSGNTSMPQFTVTGVAVNV